MKKLINSSLLALCMLFGASQANAMFKKFLVGAGIVATPFVKKYAYDPLKTQVKYRKYRANPEIQKLSNQLLDDHMKIHGGGLRKKLRVKYLKTFGYNRVYITNSEKLFTDENTQGFTRTKGGIFLRPHKNQNQSRLGHETAHLYQGDCTRLNRKFFKMYNYNAIKTVKRLKRLMKLKKSTNNYNNTEKITNLAKQFMKISKEIIKKTEAMEFSACKKNTKTLFYSGYFKPFYETITNYYSPDPYVEGRIKGLQEIINENPKHPLVDKLRQFEDAIKKVRLPNQIFWDPIILCKAELDLKDAINKFDTETPKLPESDF